MASGEIPSDRQAINQSHIVQHPEASANEICKYDSKSNRLNQEPVGKIECPMLKLKTHSGFHELFRF
jgi:hypothetical protein